MGQQLFYPPNVAGWKNNAYWVNSTALWARADFARNLTWQAHEAGFLMEIDRRATAQNQYVMTEAQAVDFAYGKFGRDPAVATGSRYDPQRARQLAEGPAGHASPRPPTQWHDWAAINLTTMMMLTPDVQLA